MLTAPVTRALDDYLDGRDRRARCSSPGPGSGWASPRPGRWSAASPPAPPWTPPGEISPHSLRVAFITGAREAGVPLEDVQDAAGHADPRTTRRYDRGRHSLDRHAAYALTTWLAEPAEGDSPSLTGPRSFASAV